MVARGVPLTFKLTAGALDRSATPVSIELELPTAEAALSFSGSLRQESDGAGISGNNLFGIKADGRWNGERVTVNTLEYDSGLPTRIRDEFRAYPSLREGFEDYVNFLKSNARYDSATKGGLTPEDYAGSLQDAGYATDPNYANKISGIVNSPRLNDLVGQLKIDTDEPIYL